MKSTRRNFIKHVGVFLAAYLTRGCTPTCYEPVAPTPAVTCYTVMPVTPSPSTDAYNALWVELKSCWLSLDDPQLQSFEDNDFIRELRRRHNAALNALAGAGQLDPAVAEQIDIAFGQAIAHIQRQMATCYIYLPPEFQPREDLLRQAELLEEMATKSELDPDTVAQAQAALERDITWLAQFQAGLGPAALEQIDLDPNAIEAARILVEMLLGR